MQPQAALSGKKPLNIVFAGNSNITLGAYQAFCKKLQAAIARQQVTITVISSSPFHTCYGLFQECIAGLIEYQNLLLPLTECYSKATVICGRVVDNAAGKKQVTAELADGSYSVIPYDHLVDGGEFFTEGNAGKSETGFALRSAADVSGLRQQLVNLVNNAAHSRDRFSASRILRISVTGKGLAGIELATGIACTVQRLCREAGLSQLKPTIYLILDNADLYEMVAFNRWLEKYMEERFYTLGVRVIKGKQVTRVNTDGAVLNDGSFINCSLVVNTGHTSNTIAQGSRGKSGEHAGNSNWSAINYFAGAMPEPAAYLAAIKQGRLLGNNIAAAIGHREQTPLSSFSRLRTGGIGGASAYFIFGKLALKGSPASFLRIWLLMRTMPPYLRNICIKNLTDNYLPVTNHSLFARHSSRQLAMEVSF